MTKSESAGFFKAELKRLIRFVRRHLDESGAVEAEDIVQEVALRFFCLPDVARPIENLSAYLFTSLQNRIIDLWRSRRRRPEVASREGILESLAVTSLEGNTPENPADLAERRDRLYLISWALEELLPEERAVVMATEVEGWSFRELADEWDTPIGTLLARKHRAIKKMRALVGAAQKKEKEASHDQS